MVGAVEVGVLTAICRGQSERERSGKDIQWIKTLFFHKKQKLLHSTLQYHKHTCIHSAYVYTYLADVV